MTPPVDMMIDTINGSVDSIPMIPREIVAIAFYVTGTPDIQWTEQHRADFPISAHVQIDQSPDLHMFANFEADVADIENFAGTIPMFLRAARLRTTRNWTSTAYVDWSNLPNLRGEVAKASLAQYVQYWIADYNLNQTQAIELLFSNTAIVAVQFASPGSNPNTILPGTTNMTLKQANCDLSVKKETWFPRPYPAAIAYRE